MSVPRAQWTSRIGIVLATIGGMASLGNIWRLSCVAGENGGAVFFFVCLAFMMLIGISLMIAEMTIGHHVQVNAIFAFDIKRKRGAWNLVAGSASSDWLLKI